VPGVAVVWSPRTTRHEPGAELFVGVPIPAAEVPARVPAIHDALEAAGHVLHVAEACDDEALLAVHDPGLVEQLRTTHDRWLRSGLPDDPGQRHVVPYVFATAGMLGPLPPSPAAAEHARAGAWCYDTMTWVGPGTWEAARAAVDCAVGATALVLEGASVAYALCRPPGHHVTRSAYGGSCYLNNAAVAAQRLRDGGHERVAVVDVDAHHGNGTAAIFYERGDVLYGSVHVDPAAGWFPHVVGHAGERGLGDGAGATLNLPLGPGSGDDAWCAAVERLAEAVRRHGATALVVSLGVDAAVDDPESPLRVSVDGYRKTGRLLGALDLPSVVVQEGGYHLPSLGRLVTAYLGGHADGGAAPAGSPGGRRG
jgi:acetoin utilization deacetylase AcuC-like enzyme